MHDMDKNTNKENNRLGRGLSALLSQQAQDNELATNSLQVIEVDIRKLNLIHTNPDNN